MGRIKHFTELPYIFTDHSGKKRVPLGSANFTNGELQKNEEILLLLENPDLIDEISDYFEGLWQQTFLFEDADNSYRNLHVRQRSQRMNIDKNLSKQPVKNRTLSLMLTDSLELQKIIH